MLPDDVTFFFHEIQGDAVVEFDAVERAEPDRRGASQDAGQERRGSLRITGRNDCVIELNGHGAPPDWASDTVTHDRLHWASG